MIKTMRRKPRCPKCHSIPHEFREVWSGQGLSFHSDAEGKPTYEGYRTEGTPTDVIASCLTCGNTWRLRGITQISEVRELFD